MDFEREEPKCKFSIVDRPNVRQQLEYFSVIAGGLDKDMLVRYWMGAQALIVNWECDIVPSVKPDPKEKKETGFFDIEKETNPEIVDLIVWAGLEVKKFMSGLDNIPKNL